jgi:hypothetical protein
MVQQVIVDQTSTNQVIASLSTAVSNLTTKQETAIMHNRIEHMFAQLVVKTSQLPYSPALEEFPQELQLTQYGNRTDNDIGMGDATSEEGPISEEETKSKLTDNTTYMTTLGPGNQTNSRLELSHNNFQPAQK